MLPPMANKTSAVPAPLHDIIFGDLSSSSLLCYREVSWQFLACDRLTTVRDTRVRLAVRPGVRGSWPWARARADQQQSPWASGVFWFG